MQHNLKIQKRWLEAVEAGEKRAEIRKADRGFSQGDELLLYTIEKDAAVIARISHVLRLSEVLGEGGSGFVSLSLADVTSVPAREIDAALARGSYGHRAYEVR